MSLQWKTIMKTSLRNDFKIKLKPWPGLTTMGSGAAVFVLGPAGSGKSTFCQHLLQYCSVISRPAHLFNLDPAADTEPDPLPNPASKTVQQKFSPSKDIKELVTVEEVMEGIGLGPNGGLVYALEALLEHREWLDDDLDRYEDEFLVVDCPGQIELYSLHDIFPKILNIFQQRGYRVCVVYLMESQFLQDVSKYFAGVLHAASTMLQLGVPHINVVSKMDMLSEFLELNDSIEYEDICEECHPLHAYFFPDPINLQSRLSERLPKRYRALTDALVQLVDDFDVVSFVPVDVRQEESLERVMILIDNATQYSEMLEPKEPKFEEEGDDDDNPDFDQYESEDQYQDYDLEAVSDDLENID